MLSGIVGFCERSFSSLIVIIYHTNRRLSRARVKINVIK
jgi:hypothetical protein